MIGMTLLLSFLQYNKGKKTEKNIILQDCLYFESVASLCNGFVEDLQAFTNDYIKNNALNEFFIFTLDRNRIDRFGLVNSFIQQMYNAYVEICGLKRFYRCFINDNSKQNNETLKVDFLHLIKSLIYLNDTYENEDVELNILKDKTIHYYKHNVENKNFDVFQNIKKNTEITIIDNCSAVFEDFMLFYKMIKFASYQCHFPKNSNFLFLMLRFDNLVLKKEWDICMQKICYNVISNSFNYVIGMFYNYSILNFITQIKSSQSKQNALVRKSITIRDNVILLYPFPIIIFERYRNSYEHKELIANLFGLIGTIRFGRIVKDTLIKNCKIIQDLQYFITISTIEGLYRFYFCVTVYKDPYYQNRLTIDSYKVCVSIYRYVDANKILACRFCYNFKILNLNKLTKARNKNKEYEYYFSANRSAAETFFFWFQNLKTVNNLYMNNYYNCTDIFYNAKHCHLTRQNCFKYEIISNEIHSHNIHANFLKRLSSLEFDQLYIESFHVRVNKNQIFNMIETKEFSLLYTLEILSPKVDILDISADYEKYNSLLIKIRFTYNLQLKSYMVILPIRENLYLSCINLVMDKIYYDQICSEFIDNLSPENLQYSNYIRKVIRYTMNIKNIHNCLALIMLGNYGNRVLFQYLFHAMIFYLDLQPTIKKKNDIK